MPGEREHEILHRCIAGDGTELGGGGGGHIKPVSGKGAPGCLFPMFQVSTILVVSLFIGSISRTFGNCVSMLIAHANSPEQRRGGEKSMLSMMGALCLSIQTNSNLRGHSHRLYFRQCQLIQSAQISNLDKTTTMATSTC